MNRFMTLEEVSQEIISPLMNVIFDVSGQDMYTARGMVYDLQTSLGGFPVDIAQRRRYMETGKF